MDTGLLFLFLGAQVEKICCFIIIFFTLLSLQSDGVLAAGVPRTIRDGELVCKISGGAGCDGFVNDAAGFEDGAVQQQVAMEFYQDEDDVLIFLQALDETCCDV